MKFLYMVVLILFKIWSDTNVGVLTNTTNECSVTSKLIEEMDLFTFINMQIMDETIIIHVNAVISSYLEKNWLELRYFVH